MRARRSAGALFWAIAAIALTSPRSHADDAKPYWQLTSGRLTVVSNSSAQRCERLAASLVRFEQALAELAGWPPDIALTPVRFYSLDRADAKALMLSEADRERLRRNRNLIIHSKYRPDADFDVLAIADIGGSEPLQSVLFMHGQGQLTHGPTRGYPAWFQLGVASLLNGLVIKSDGTVLLNRSLTVAAVEERGRRPTERIDLAQLLTMQPDTSSPAAYNAFVPHAREWAIFGLLTSDERRKQYHRLAQAMQQNTPLEEAMLASFGRSLAEVTAEFDENKWRRDVRFRLPPPATPIELPAATPVAPAELEPMMRILAERAQRSDE